VVLVRFAFHQVRESGVFGRRRREAEAEARDAVMQALARLERGLEEQTRALAVTSDTVQHLHSTVVDTRSDLIETVKYLYDVSSLLIERAESAQLERQLLIETLAELTGPSTNEAPSSGERVLGGSFSELPPETVDVGAEVELRQSHWG
jgi:hypothetical protein